MKPISITIKETRERIVSALNESGLPPCVLAGIIYPIAMEIKQAVGVEVAKAEQQIAEEVQDNA